MEIFCIILSVLGVGAMLGTMLLGYEGYGNSKMNRAIGIGG